MESVHVSTSPVEGVSQRYVPAILMLSVLPLCYYLLMTGHRNEPKIHEFMRRECYGPYMVNSIYATIHGCQSCAKDHRTTRIKHKLRLYPPAGSLALVAIDILKPLTNTKTGNNSSCWWTMGSRSSQKPPRRRKTAIVVATVFARDRKPQNTVHSLDQKRPAVTVPGF